MVVAMSSAVKHAKRNTVASTQPVLANGDRMSQAEFHRRYETYPEEVKFELIGGIVFMASPLRRSHARHHANLSMVFTAYAGRTPGVELLDNATTILSDESEPQPDLCLRILTDFGGQSNETDKDYVEGPPELVAEVADGTRAIDLHLKRQDYEGAGVREYIVLSLEEPDLFWFDFRAKNSIISDRTGVARSLVFPGLWVNVPALLAEDIDALLATLNRGLKSPAHRAFKKALQERHRDRGNSTSKDATK
jgi:Uma2 family endonuclease